MSISTTTKRLLSALALVSSLLLSACVGPVFPTDNPLPYPDSKYALIEVGSSKQDEVAGVLGKPDLELRGGELWIYARSRAKLSDGLGGYSHDYQAIFVEYEDGIVVAKDILHSDQPYMVPSCWSGPMPDVSMSAFGSSTSCRAAARCRRGAGRGGRSPAWRIRGRC